jgi:acyl-CoA reductase-like NAD-dependent aldehyde dehydrogenase
MAAGPQALADSELEVVNPATLERVAMVPIDSLEAVQEAVAEARLAQRAWAAAGHAERRAVLGRTAEVLLDRLDEVAATITAETGKPFIEALTSELVVSLESLVWLASNAGSILAPERVRYPQLFLKHKRARLVYEPLGVVGIVSPWNFPLGIPLSQTAAVVAAGNGAVIKPSELAPLTGAWVERAFDEAGAPRGLVRVVQGGAETGSALVRARGIAKLVFTGSAEVGRRVAAEAGQRAVPVTLELGGKDPLIVFEDADLDRAVAGALWGAFLNCGQTCAAVERIYVQGGLYEPFVEELARRAGDLRLGRGDDPDVDVGPLVSEQQRDRVEGLLADAVEQGAVVRAGGGRPDVGLPGWFFEPTVLVDVPREARIEREELFGPVVTVARFRDEGEAVRLANDSPFALGASVWTRDPELARRIARSLEAGMVWTNDVAYSYGAHQASWGGRKGSGFGVTHSKHGLYAVSSVKFVDEDAGRVGVPWWFPYDARVADGFRGFLGLFYGRGLGTKASAVVRHRRGLLELVRRMLR